MGRSRGVPNSGDDDTNHRSKRRRVASSGDATDFLSAACGGVGGGKKALYHCNYCNKDLSGKIRIKCSKCPDFDLCVECFSVGAEVTPHRSNHPYRVMDNLSFPLICPDWNAHEEPSWFQKRQIKAKRAFCLKLDLEDRMYEAHLFHKKAAQRQKDMMKHMDIPVSDGSEDDITPKHEWLSKQGYWSDEDAPPDGDRFQAPSSSTHHGGGGA